MPNRRTTVALVAAVGLLCALVNASTGNAAPAAPPPGAAAARTYTLPLVTGDVAQLSVFPNGRQAASLVPQPGRRADRGYQLRQVEGDLQLLPAEAVPYVDSGQLDPTLFNLTALVAQGYGNAASIPLLLTPTPARARAKAAPALPKALAKQRAFPRLATLAVTPRQGQVRTFWESIDDDSRTRTPHLAGGIGKVWLDGRVKATLDQSTKQIGAPSAWQAGLDGKGVKVAVLDTGYDTGHPDLAKSVATSKSFVPGETVQDGMGHGTHVASTIAGSGAASTGKAVRKGVAPGAKLVVGKVLDDTGVGYDSWILGGMEWAVAQGAKVVSMSLGGPVPSDGSDPLSQAVDTLSASSGALFVVAAGNAGPDATTVTFPGAAASALTVGAVDRKGELASFSSRGLRLGDGMVKPEVTAPGVGVVAARAAGTHAGNDVSEDYTAMSGTSMATPHVAGAAAILAQKHPDWTGQQLKSALVASARPTSKGASAAQQGLGLIDIPTALKGGVVGTPSVAIGTVAWTGDARPVVKRTVQYRNTSNRAVSLTLSADVASTEYGRHPDAAVTFSPRRLTIQPGGTASTTVSLDADKSGHGTYAGHLAARAGNGSSVRTAYSAVIEGELHPVTVTATNRDGKPAEAISTNVQLLDLDTNALTYHQFVAGKAELRISPGRYSLTAFVMTEDEEFFAKSVAVFGKPDFDVRGPMSLHFDARKAERVDITTPRQADPNSYIIAWNRTVGGRQTLFGWNLPGGITKDVYVQRFDRARNGTFEITHRWDLRQPQLTVDVLGKGGFRLPSPNADFGTLFVGDEQARIVDAGTGTPSELAAAKAGGAVALVRWRAYEATEEQIAAAAEAGVKVMLLWRDAPGFWNDGIFQPPMPYYTLQYAEGRKLRDLLASGGERQARLVGVPDSTYRYDLMFVERDVDGPIRYDVRRLPTARIVTDFKFHAGREGGQSDRRAAFVPGIDVAFELARLVSAPLRRSDYVLAGRQLAWASGSTADLWNWAGDEYGLSRTVRRGEVVRQDWWGAVTRPAVPDVTGAEELGLPVARFEDAIRVLIPPFVSGDALVYGWGDGRGLQDRSTLVLRRDGKEVGRYEGYAGQFPVPASSGRYALELSVQRFDRSWATTSMATRSVWSFTSSHARRPTVLPLLQVRYGLSADLMNAVPRSGGRLLTLDAGYQPGVRGPGRISLRAEVSYDGGWSWRTAPMSRGRAWLPPAPAGASSGSLRVTATDRAGNKLVQTITDAWHLR